MTAIAGEHIEKAPTNAVTKARLKWLAYAALGGLIVFAGARYGYDYWTVGRFIESTDDAYPGGNVTPISPHVAGFVAQILVGDNEYVHAGQPLIRLDDRDFRAAADRAAAIVAARKATLESLERKLTMQQTTIRQAKADLDAKTAQAAFAKQDDQRYRDLAQTAAGSRQNAERASSLNLAAEASVVSSAAGLDAAKQQLTVLDAEIAVAKADVAQAEADLHTAELNLGYTEIRSPIDGYVGNRAAEIGAYVAGGAYLVTIIPAHDLWVDANFKESQLERMSAGTSSDGGRRRPPGPCLSWSCRQRRPGDRRGLQRDPARKRDRQLHQDRSARSRPHQARWRPDASRAATRALDNGRRGHAIGFGRRAMTAAATTAAAPSTKSWVWSLGPFVVMCVGMFIALLDIQIVASSLQDIGGGLSAAQDQISWVQTAYLIAEIIMIPLSGWLTRVFSTRWLFTASAAGFTAASMLCGLAWNIESMIVFRAMQGLLGASMIPIVFTSTFHYFQGPRRVYSAAVVGGIATVAPTLGPVIGGFITDTLDWRWLFYVNVVPGLAISILVPLLVKIDEPDLSLLKGADYPGIVLMAIALGTLEYVLEEGSRWNWFDDATIRDCAMIAAVAGFLFVLRSLTFPRPVVDLRALGNRNFTLGCVLSFITGIGIFSTIYLTPLFLGYVRGFSAWQTGMAIFSTGLASLVGVPIYVMLARKFDTRWLMMAGLASFGLSMWGFSFITHDWGAAELLLPQVLRGFPQVFAVAPSVNLGLGSLPPERLKYASGLFNMMRNLGGAVGIAVCGAILNDRTNFHFQAIASNLTPANGAMTRLVSEVAERYAAIPGSPQAGHQAALKQLWLLAYREASTLAYADAFLAIMVAFIFATLLVPFMRNVSAPKVPAQAAH